MENDNLRDKALNNINVNVLTNSGSGSQDIFNKILQNEKLLIYLRITLIGIGSTLAVILIFAFFLYALPGLQQLSSGSKAKLSKVSELLDDQAYRKQTSLMQKELHQLSRKYSSFTSGLSYVVINTIDNRFLLYRNKKMIREGFCSSGSYTMLKTQGEKKWIFKTPKGKYWIRGKTTSPVWRRPDWAFVEEGLPVPSDNDPSRWEYGVLGDYAMSIGDGYLIHGTLYKRFLGMPVTHGCVRLNDEDLEAIYNTLSIGSKVYIF